jgi:sialate O-acetylesterase
MASALRAEVKLPTLLGDGMVLQRLATVTLWGRADAGATLTVVPSWDGKTYTTTVASDGRWSVAVPTVEAGGPYEITVNDGGAPIVLRDVLLGEVWVCSGQSNMAATMRGGFSEPVTGANEAVARSSLYPNIRMFTVGRARSATPAEECTGQWKTSTSANVLNFSAISTFFGRTLNEILGVPIGLIDASWGGTFIEAWMDADSQQGVTPAAVSTTSSMNTELYNGMIVPLLPYAIAGWIWYQGENNQVNPLNYAPLMQRMVTLWRAKWGRGDLPFYYVQIAPYIYSDAPRDGVSVAEIRDQQVRAMSLIPNSGMAPSLDLGDPVTVHNPNKRQGGERLAWWALANTYGVEGLVFRAPEYRSMEVGEDGRVRVSFDHAPSGLIPCEVELEGFELAGEDRVFHPARAIQRFGRRNPLEVWSDAVPRPVAVRYGWRNLASASLFGTSGLPVNSFRSDDWEIDYPYKNRD